MTTARILLLSLTGLLLAACAPVGKGAADKLAKNTSSSVACKSSDSYFFNSLNAIPLNGEEFPEVSVVEESLRAQLDADFESGRIKASGKEKVEAFIEQYLRLYKLGANELPEKLGLKTTHEVVAAISALELGDRTTVEKSELQDEWEKIKEPLTLAAAALEGECAEPLPEDPVDSEEVPLVESTPLLEALKNNYSAPVYGVLKSLAVAYQSCGVVELAPMNDSSPSVEGVEVYGRHPNGVGNLRRVASLPDVVRTHYYIRDQYPPATSCFQVREKPLIYDYGGKPYATTSMTSSLDFFQNAGSGAPGLGVDCSGYVFTAYAAAGLKMRGDQPLKASQVYGISASMMKEPQNNGLSCMSKVSGDLKPGDLIASSGHVVMVDSVGDDPFGIAGITKESDCVVSKMALSRFDFVISQSSPSKGAIGINRMLAKTYFPTSDSMGEALKHQAVSACLKKFGKTTTAPTSLASVVRHKGTETCKATAVPLAKQECLSSCSL